MMESLHAVSSECIFIIHIIMHLLLKQCHCTQCGSSDRFNLGNSLPRLVNQNIRGL